MTNTVKHCRLWVTVVSLAILCLLTACGGEESSQSIQKTERELAQETEQAENALAMQAVKDGKFDVAYEHYLKASEAYTIVYNDSYYEKAPRYSTNVADTLVNEAFARTNEQILAAEPYLAINALCAADSFAKRLLIDIINKQPYSSNRVDYMRSKKQEIVDLELSYLKQIAVINVQITDISDLAKDGGAAFIGWFTEQPWWGTVEPYSEYPSRLYFINYEMSSQQKESEFDDIHPFYNRAAYELRQMHNEVKQILGVRLAEYYQSHGDELKALIWYSFAYPKYGFSHDIDYTMPISGLNANEFKAQSYRISEIPFDIKNKLIYTLRSLPYCLETLNIDIPDDMSELFRADKIGDIAASIQKYNDIETYNRRTIISLDGYYGGTATFDLNGEYSTFSFEYNPTGREEGIQYYLEEDGVNFEVSMPVDINAEIVSVEWNNEIGLYQCVYDISGITKLQITSAVKGISYTPYSQVARLSNVYFNK